MSTTAATIAGPAGPAGPSAARWWARMARDPLGTYAALDRAYGDAIRLPLSRRSTLFILSRPEHAEHVLLTHQDNYRRPFTYRPLRAYLGDGLLTAEGEIWARHRKLIAPAFAHRSVAGLAPAIADASAHTAAQWGDGETIDLAAQMRALTLTIAGRALFGTDLTADAPAISRALMVLQRAVVPASFLPTARSARATRRVLDVVPQVRAAARTLDEVVARIIAERSSLIEHPAHAELPADVLSTMLSADPPLTQDQLHDEILTLMLAGHETTAGALTWTLTLLSRFPQVRRRLETEAADNGGGLDPRALPYATAVLHESMRLYPPAWTIEREAIGDDIVAGVPVPAGSTVAVPPYLIHRRPDIWPDPEGFDPERFLPGAPQRPEFSFVPFGGGKRICVGSNFAMLEATLALSHLARTHSIDLAVGGPPPPRVGVTMYPAGPVWATVHRR